MSRVELQTVATYLRLKRLVRSIRRALELQRVDFYAILDGLGDREHHARAQ